MNATDVHHISVPALSMLVSRCCSAAVAAAAAAAVAAVPAEPAARVPATAGPVAVAGPVAAAAVSVTAHKAKGLSFY
jgi:hypothetical protein